MASLMKKYKMGQSRLARATKTGFDLTPEGELVFSGYFTGGRHVFFSHLDGGMDACPWGRLVFDARWGENTVFSVTAYASDDKELPWYGKNVDVDEFLADGDVSGSSKTLFLNRAGATQSFGFRDVLIHRQKGRYLWICLTAQGEDAAFSNIRVFAPGDNFFQTFPEVYRADGDFFHRYISVFSSIYNDFQEKIDTIDMLLDLDTAPEGLLPVYASWFGIVLDGDFIEESQLRALLKNAFSLIGGKGTRQALETLIGIFVKDPFYIVEQHVARRFAYSGDRAAEILYGSDPFSFTLMINSEADEKLHSRLKFLLAQFKPIRVRPKILFMKGNGALDAGSFLDINAAVAQNRPAGLDERFVLNRVDYMT
ncbi:MAG: hypothetical protein LBT26_08695 [Clostridiales Family XIII bacterium]|jgi:phage tail-like protein|nr:hypothetical protein [Clostridiales Family XIII bacterium]